MAVARIKFAKRDPTRFVEESKRRVAEYFEQSGRSQKAGASMVIKTIVILATAIGTYLAILSGRFSAWEMLGLAMLMGVAMAGIGFSISHDALHGAYSSNQRINRMLGFTFDLSGANGYMWKITHNVIHHTYTNIPGIDEDLTVSPLLRLSPGADLKWFHRYQHIYGFAAYSMATINWIFMKDYQQFLKKDLGPYKDRKHPKSEWFNLIWTKLFCYAYMIIIPLIVLDITWWQFVIGFTAMHLVAGTTLGVIFQLSHVVEGTEFPVPDEHGQMEHQWVIHEMETTADFAHGNTALSWYIGGLNYQIEHHLFPQICSVHYPAISKIIQEVAHETGVPYNNAPTLRAAIRSHYNMLRQLGQSDPVATPEFVHG